MRLGYDTFDCHPFSPIFTHLYRSWHMLLECFHFRLTQKELMIHMHAMDVCGEHASKQSDSRDRGLVSRFNSDSNLK